MPSMEHKLSLNPDQLAKLEAAKEWGKRNWKPFVAGAAVAGVTLLVFRGRLAPTIINNTANPVFNNLPIFNNTINNAGYMRKIVRCVETDEMWSSIGRAANATGHSLHAMSRHLNGHTDDLEGLHYVIEGLAAG